MYHLDSRTFTRSPNGFMPRAKTAGLQLLGDIVRQCRGAPSLRDFGEAVGVNKQTVARLERGEHTPTIQTLRLFSPHIGYSVEEMLAIIDCRFAVEKREFIQWQDALGLLQDLEVGQKIDLMRHIFISLNKDTKKEVVVRLLNNIC